MLAGYVQTDSRYSLTGSFLHAAAIFVKRAYEIEASTTANSLTEEIVAEHRGCVLAAVMQSVAALEAEIFEVVVHGPGHHLGSNLLDTAARDFLAPLAETIDQQEVLRRYSLVLHLLKKTPIPADEALWENARLLIKLRNELVHYKSRWASELDTTKLIASLQKLDLPRARFTSEYETKFPQRYLSAPCAAWAVKTSLAFLLEFYARIGFPSPVAQLEAKIKALLVAP